VEGRTTGTNPLTCLTSSTSYPASRITSACSCLGVPAVTVSVTATTTTTANVTSTTTTSATATVTAGCYKGQTCGSYTFYPCSTGVDDICLCGLDPDGGTYCFANFYCGDTPSCQSNFDCDSGYFCAAQTCCGQSYCAPLTPGACRNPMHSRSIFGSAAKPSNEKRGCTAASPC